jgi:hypothetical protein
MTSAALTRRSTIGARIRPHGNRRHGASGSDARAIGGQGAGNGKNVIEPGVKKLNVTMRLDQPAIRGIQRAANQKERIKNISEPPHNSAMIMRPNPKPSKIFNSKILDKITPKSQSTSQAGRARIRMGFHTLLFALAHLLMLRFAEALGTAPIKCQN